MAAPYNVQPHVLPPVLTLRRFKVKLFCRTLYRATAYLAASLNFTRLQLPGLNCVAAPCNVQLHVLPPVLTLRSFKVKLFGRTL